MKRFMPQQLSSLSSQWYYIVKDVITVKKYLIHQKKKIASLHLKNIIHSIAAANALWADPKYPLRKRIITKLQLSTGFSYGVLNEGMNTFFGMWNNNILEKLFEYEIGEFKTGFYKNTLPFMIHYFAGNIPTSPIMSIMCSLLAGVPFVGKTTTSIHSFVVAYIQTLQKIDPSLANNCIIDYWTGNNTDQLQLLQKYFPHWIVYGSETTTDTIKNIIPKKQLRAVYGEKFSVVYLPDLDISKKECEKLFYDIALYDQMGCLSPQVIFFPKRFIDDFPFFKERLVKAKDSISGTLQPRDLSSSEKITESNLIHQLQFRQAQNYIYEFHDDVFVVHPTLLYWRPGFRNIIVSPVTHFNHFIAIMKPYKKYLSTIASTKKFSSLQENKLYKAGFSRICEVGEMHKPDHMWNHDGVGNIKPYLTHPPTPSLKKRGGASSAY
ncbi:acyl-CoA reductase [Candidatus Margulisiibacteriota bacterium]